MSDRSTHRNPSQEQSDIDSPRIMWVGFALVLVVVISTTLIDEFVHKQKFSASAENGDGRPRYLQTDPRAERLKIEREAERRLHLYSATGEKGYAQIPIDRAMQLLSNADAEPKP